MDKLTENDVKRFFDKVDVRGKDECWEWKACTGYFGYGKFGIRNVVFYAHRISWIIANGDIPDNLIVCHKCDNPPCVNPNHLFLGTHWDNQHDKISKGRHPTGEKDAKSKLTDEQVHFIKTNYSPRHSKYSETKLAEMFGVNRTTIEAIVVGRNWKHID